MSDLGLQQVLQRLSHNLTRDSLVQQVTNQLKVYLEVDRILVYYFYRQWQGQVTFEVISSPQLSILGSTGPDECFNGDYASMYQAGRIKAIADIETANIADCHRDFLRKLQVRANLVAPVLSQQQLWGLLIAHHCQNPRNWSAEEIQMMQTGAARLERSGILN
ncbi:putative GAF sensor protein [Stanieria cyanosphaera PCC 7437]|uniref:GAF sensor protein n=1 Tax=Stanieria cyanosphaera (strain ATCC 29371 / PCC 7437) TaxID=111780 RepID=K9XTP1_STAC7|nr:GAF domain-containing protein [Stanieria cyanosphaera]AFZ35908.1 putative GAF sensor protein [Stanieria cyanosphaera PCC 7437]